MIVQMQTALKSYMELKCVAKQKAPSGAFL
jgi:hypothetical protein